MKSIIEIMYMAGIDPDELADEIKWNSDNIHENESTFTYYSGILMGLYLSKAITKKEQHSTLCVLRDLRFGMIRTYY